jgi:hypothetical protein
MPKKLKRDKLWEAILASGIFKAPSLFHDGTFWCVSFENPDAPIGRSFIAIGRNLAKAEAWVQRNRGETYP